MTPTDDRSAAAALIQRIENGLAAANEDTNLPTNDKPPAFADWLMPDEPASGNNLTPADWQLILTALKHFASS
jgi:hypothetical protein